jgi:hypothetical protein
MPPHKSRIIPIFLAAGITLSLLFTLLSVSTFAQGSPTPTPFVEDWYLDTEREWDDNRFAEPGTSVGDASWAVGESSFSSSYPDGFSFTVNASSDQGDIVTASVIWSHTPDELQRREVRNVPASGEITLPVRLGEPLAPFAAVNYYWSFIDSEGNRFRTEWIVGNEFLPNNLELWQRFESEDIILVLEGDLPDELVDMTFDAMEQQRETFKQAWGRTLSYKPRVVLFADREEFDRVFGLFFVSVVGRTDSRWGATVQVVVDNDLTDLAYGTVPHEIAHLYQFDVVGDDGFPAGSWFSEGNATLFELSQPYDYLDRVRNFADRDELPSLLLGSYDTLFASSVGSDGLGRLGYDIGYSFFHWMVLNYGLDAHRVMVEALIDGADRNEAIQQAIGLPLSEIETNWARWLGADGPAPTPPPINEIRFPPTPTPFGQ